MRLRFCVILLVLILASCMGNEPVPYTLSKEIHLSEYQIISPFFIEQLNESPIKQCPAWNDSLVKLTGIHAINISSKGMSNPEDPAEILNFVFDNKGRLAEFEHSKFDISEKPLTSINYKGNNGRLNVYFGENVNNKLKCKQESDWLVFTRIRENGNIDSFMVSGNLNKPKIILEKSGKFLSKINIILKMNEPVKNAGKVLSNLKLSPDELYNAEKTVTYVDESYKPLKTYLISEDLIQSSLIAEWNYENNKKLISYRRFVNTSPVKEYEFVYSEDKLLRSFVYNRINYTVDYQ